MGKVARPRATTVRVLAVLALRHRRARVSVTLRRRHERRPGSWQVTRPRSCRWTCGVRRPGRGTRHLDSLRGDGSASPPAVVISAVSGTAGVGKTALAVHWAHQVAARFPDGQLYVNLRGFDPSGRRDEPAEALRGFLDALGVPPQTDPGRPGRPGRPLPEPARRPADAGRARQRPGRRAGPAAAARDWPVPGRGDEPQPAAGLVAPTAPSRSIWTCCRRGGSAAAGPAAGRAASPPNRPPPTDIVAACAPPAAGAGDSRGPGRRSAGAAPDPVVEELGEAGWTPSRDGPRHRRPDRLQRSYRGLRAERPPCSACWPCTRARLHCRGGGQPGRRSAPASAARLRGAHAGPPGDPHGANRYAFHDLLRAYAPEMSRAEDSEPERRDASARLLGHYAATAYAADRLVDPSRRDIDPSPAEPAVGAVIEMFAGAQQAKAWLTAERRALLPILSLAAERGFQRHAFQFGLEPPHFQRAPRPLARHGRCRSDRPRRRRPPPPRRRPRLRSPRARPRSYDARPVP